MVCHRYDLIAYVLYVLYQNVNLQNIFHCDNAIQNFTVSYFSVICFNSYNKLCMAIFLLLYTVATVQLILPAIQSSFPLVSRGVMRSAASPYAAMHMVAGSRPVFVIA